MSTLPPPATSSDPKAHSNMPEHDALHQLQPSEPKPGHDSPVGHHEVKHHEEPAPAPLSPIQRLGKWNYRLRLATGLFLPVFVEAMDYTIVAAAQPRIASAFNRLDLQSWVGTAYVLTSTVFLPFYACLADIYGRHVALQVSNIIFLLGSALCTAAQNMPMLLAGRAISGIGAAGSVSVVRVILIDGATLDDANFQTAILIILYSIAMSVGPVIGGVLVDHSFRWVFGINLPCGVLSILLGFICLRGIVKGPQSASRSHHAVTTTTGAPLEDDDIKPESRETFGQKLARLDWLGVVLFVIGGIVFMLALSWGSTIDPWSAPRVIACFVVGGVLIIAFVVWQYMMGCVWNRPTRDGQPTQGPPFKWLRRTEVLIPLGLFKNYDVVACSFASFTSGMVFLSAFYFCAIFFSVVQGTTSTNAGVQLLYFAPGLGVGTYIQLFLIRFFRQPKYPIVFGMLMLTVGSGLLSMAMHSGVTAQVNGFMAMSGVGVGATFGPLAIHIVFVTAENLVAVSQTLILLFRTLGGTIGLAQLGAVLQTRVRRSLIISFASLTSAQMAQLAAALSAATDSLGAINDLDPDLREVVQLAYRDGCRWAFISLIPWCAIAFVLSLFLRIIPADVLDRSPRFKKKDKAPQAAVTSPATANNASTDDALDVPEPKFHMRPIDMALSLCTVGLWRLFVYVRYRRRLATYRAARKPPVVPETKEANGV